MKLEQSIAKKMVFLIMIAIFLGSLQTAMAVSSGGGNLEEAVIVKSSSGVEFTLGGGAGYLTGRSRKYVYESNMTVSELIWDIDALYVTILESTLNFGSRFRINMDGWFKAVNGDGTTDDYDWYIDGADWTHWSHHEDVTITTFNKFDINAEFSAFRVQSLVFNIVTGFNRNKFGWDIRGGTYTYSSKGTGDRSRRGSFADGLPTCSYKQTLDAIYGGFEIDITIERLNLSSRIIYSPIVMAKNVDHHHLRDLVIRDSFEDGEMTGFDIAANYSINEKIVVGVGYSHQFYDTIIGDADYYYNDVGEVSKLPNAAGTNHRSSILSVALKYNF